MTLWSYVVRYDSGFAPNPFYNRCTLATCKPEIRASANAGDWIVGTGSDEKQVRLGGRLVYAMQVAETLRFEDYDADPRFTAKRPFRQGSRKQSCGDNIYFRDAETGEWRQRDSFHSRADGSSNPDHVRRDTGVNRVLVSERFVYFGGEGPIVPSGLVDLQGRPVVKKGIGRSRFDDPALIASFETWIASLGVVGYQGRPQEWIALAGRA